MLDWLLGTIFLDLLTVPFRGTFIIDPKQNIRVAMINDLPIGRNVNEVMRLLEAIQFNEEHGEGN